MTDPNALPCAFGYCTAPAAVITWHHQTRFTAIAITDHARAHALADDARCLDCACTELAALATETTLPGEKPETEQETPCHA